MVIRNTGPMPQVSVAGDSAPTRQHEPALPDIAWRSVVPAMAVLALVLTVLSNGYGFNRDELYFRMLTPAWGYVDQPPLAPLFARLTAHLSADPAATRIPATVFAAMSVLVVVLITRELGGGRGAQTLCAWAYAFAATPLLFGHVLLTAALDLLVWPLVCLFLIRALLRRQPRWWLLTGLVVGLSTYNKLLVTLLVIALTAGLLISGPRRALLSKWVLGAVVLAVLLALPNLIYQATHSWPQLTMGRALSRQNASSVRITMWPFLLLLLGPPLVPIWVAGLIALWRRPKWRPVRFLTVAFAVVLIETFIAGGQVYYPVGLLVVVFAAGCVPAADFLARSRSWRGVAIVAIVVNAAVSAVIALPVLPKAALPDSPVPAINPLVGDEIGWPEYVGQVAGVYRQIPVPERGRTVIITSNYGEAGAIVRYGPALGLPRPYSGHNELYFDAHPPQGTSTAVVVGAALHRAQPLFASCTVQARLHSNAGVDNEEQHQPVAVCRQPTQDWTVIWRALQHYD
jgi:hypothetical protein